VTDDIQRAIVAVRWTAFVHGDDDPDLGA